MLVFPQGGSFIRFVPYIVFQPIQDVDIELPDALRMVLEKDFFSVTNDRQVSLCYTISG